MKFHVYQAFFLETRKATEEKKTAAMAEGASRVRSAPRPAADPGIKRPPRPFFSVVFCIHHRVVFVVAFCSSGGC